MILMLMHQVLPSIEEIDSGMCCIGGTRGLLPFEIPNNIYDSAVGGCTSRLFPRSSTWRTPNPAMQPYHRKKRPPLLLHVHPMVVLSKKYQRMGDWRNAVSLCGTRYCQTQKITYKWRNNYILFWSLTIREPSYAMEKRNTTPVAKARNASNIIHSIDA